MEFIINVIKGNLAIILSVITMFSLIWSNIENRKSRQYQYRPHLSFQRHQTQTYLFEHEVDKCDFKELFIKHFDGKLEWFKLTIKNIGVGFAKDIEVEFDYSEIVDELVKYASDADGLYYCRDAPHEDFFGINSFLDVDICDYYNFKSGRKVKVHYENILTVGQDFELYLSIHVNLLGFVCMMHEYKCRNTFLIPYKMLYKSIDEKKLTHNGFLEIQFSDSYDLEVSHREYNKILNHLINDDVDIKKEIPFVFRVNTVSIIAK